MTTPRFSPVAYWVGVDFAIVIVVFVSRLAMHRQRPQFAVAIHASSVRYALAREAAKHHRDALGRETLDNWSYA